MPASPDRSRACAPRRPALSRLATVVATVVAVTTITAWSAGAARAEATAAGSTPSRPTVATGTPTATASTQLAVAKVPKLTWRACGGRYLCAGAKVPLDWSKPRGSTISLALIKLPATNRKGRIGTLFVNPGGPGGSGVELVREAPEAVPGAVRARFDVVGFDPRFVGSSRPFGTCLPDDAFADFISSQPAFPVTGAEEATFIDAQETYAKRCSQRKYLAYASTGSVARDLELLRRAVGDSKLSYLGYSYGSYLGQVYAQLFPGKVRAMVIDGVLDGKAWISGDGDEWRSTPFSARVGSAEGSSAALSEFFRLCRAGGTARCAMNRVGDPETVYREIADALLAEPIPLGGGLELDYPTLVSATTSALYAPTSWQSFASELAALSRELDSVDAPSGAAARPSAVKAAKVRLVAAARKLQVRSPQAGRRPVMPTLQMPGLGLERPLPNRPPAVPAAIPADNGLASFGAVTCTDTLNPSDGGIWGDAADDLEDDNTYFGRGWAWSGALCIGWTQRDPNAYRGRFGIKTAAPLLVIGNTHDPATPYAGAVITAQRFPGARLLTVRGYGHTSAATPNACATRSVSNYLLTGNPPKAGAYCRQDVAPFTG
jgi:pimeloyl-ACP methyl ester carboxylesterase